MDERPRLAGGNIVHLWKVLYSPLGNAAARLERSLSEEERRRSEQFRFAADQQRFIIARGVLRTVLGHYVGMPPEQLSFRYGPNGKPALAGDVAADPLHFNLSHCSDLALLAITWHRNLGVDVERIRTTAELEAIVERYFGEEERRLLACAETEDRDRAFLQLWTRREAVAKAFGLGLETASLLRLPAYQPGGGAALGPAALPCVGLPRIAATYYLQDLQVGPEHASALCVEGTQCAIQWRQADDLLGP